MKTYLIEMCKRDGTTPMGKCPVYEYEAEDAIAARVQAYKEHADEEIVSFGLKSEIEAYRKKYGR